MTIINTYPYSSFKEKMKLIKNELKNKRYSDFGNMLYVESYIDDEKSAGKLVWEYKHECKN